MTTLTDLEDTVQAAPAARNGVTRRQVEEAVRTLIAWSGDDPDRDGLVGTPSRVADAYREYFKGYREDALAWLSDADVDMARGYDDMIMLHGVRLQSFCEHHMTPFEGHRTAWPILPDRQICRPVPARHASWRRSGQAPADTGSPDRADRAYPRARGCSRAVSPFFIEAEHQCMSLRGIRQHGVKAVTNRFVGAFADDATLRERFMRLATRRTAD